MAEWKINNKITKDKFRFGDLSNSAIIINETYQANVRSLGSVLDPFDDFYAALGRATLNIAVQGIVEQKRGKRGVLIVDGMAVYIRDSYDFNGDQGLGYWNRAGVSSYAAGAETIPVRTPQANNDADYAVGIGSLSVVRARYFEVNNASFRNYRQLNRRGGDYNIFSDVHRLSMLPGNPEIFL